MAKLFDIRPRWRNLLLVRAFLFILSIALSTSREDILPNDADDGNLRASRGFGHGGGAFGELVEHAKRELHTKAAKAKSSKASSKSGKGSKSKSAKAISSKIGKGSKSKAAKSKAWSSKTKSVKGKSAKSFHVEESQDSISLNDPGPETSGDNTRSAPLPKEDEQSVMASVRYDSSTEYNEGDASASSISLDEGKEDTEGTRGKGASESPESAHGDIDVTSAEVEIIPPPPNLEGDFAVERMEESSSDFDGDAEAQSTDGVSSESADTDSADAVQQDIVEDTPAGTGNGAAITSNAEFIEERINEGEAIEEVSEEEAVLDLSREAVE